LAADALPAQGPEEGPMKGTITNCLAALVVEKFGAEHWKAIPVDAKVDPSTASLLRLPTSDIDDAIVLALLDATCRVLGIPLEAAADAFGEYWCCRRALLPIYIGLARGVGKYFGEPLTVRKIGPDRVRIRFESKAP
jgi:hypothetical protein